MNSTLLFFQQGAIVQPSKLNNSSLNGSISVKRRIYSPKEVLWMMHQLPSMRMKATDWREGIASGKTNLPVFIVQPDECHFEAVADEAYRLAYQARNWDAVKQWMDMGNAIVVKEVVELCVERGEFKDYE